MSNTSETYTTNELMVVEAARSLSDGEKVFVGIGLPNLAVNLARRLHKPNIVMIYESGIIGADPSKVALSIGDPCLVTGSIAVCSMYDIFSNYLQNGLIDVGFLGAAQIDRFGNLNSTVIGEYSKPKVRLPGSGGACEIASHAKRLIIIMPLTKRGFPEKVDFITSPGFLGGRAERKELGLPGGGPSKVVTNMASFGFNEDGEMVLISVNPGVSLEDIRANVGWDLKMVEGGLKTTEAPSKEELRILREELDPKGIYLGRRK